MKFKNKIYNNTKNVKYIGITQKDVQDVYTENYKVFLREIKEG